MTARLDVIVKPLADGAPSGPGSDRSRDREGAESLEYATVLLKPRTKLAASAAEVGRQPIARVFWAALRQFTAANHSSRKASSGEIKLALSAGINDATNADNPRVAIATNVTTGLYGFMP